MFLRQALEQVRAAHAPRPESKPAEPEKAKAHEAAQALVADPGLSRLLTEWRQP